MFPLLFFLKMDKFLETYNLQKLNQEEMKNQNKLIPNKEIELVMKKLPTTCLHWWNLPDIQRRLWWPPSCKLIQLSAFRRTACLFLGMHSWRCGIERKKGKWLAASFVPGAFSGSKSPWLFPRRRTCCPKGEVCISREWPIKHADAKIVVTELCGKQGLLIYCLLFVPY